MAIFKKKTAKAGPSMFRGKVAFDDLDSLLQLAGVISALVVSFVIGLNATISHEEYTRYDFIDLMRMSEFRSFAVGVMDDEDASCRSHCTNAGAGASCIAGCNKQAMDWTFVNPISQNSVDLRAAMLKAKDYDYSEYDAEFEVAVHMLQSHFPMEKMLAWSTLLRGTDYYHPSGTHLVSLTWWTFSLTLSSLIVTVLLYIGLQLSNAREGGSDLYHWTFAGTAGVMFIYLALAVGLVLFLITLTTVMWSRYPVSREITRSHMGPRIFAAIVILLALGYVLFLSCVLPFFRAKQDDHGDEEQRVPDAVQESGHQTL
mmetsp:Transcript_123268/g.310274  ORF Transcript_123268/g.310274 Transcript_123268/m.310274 type:complete len:315 (+) Transcript_123268:151-1095(+)